MKNLLFLLIGFLFTLSISHAQEHVLVSGKDSLLISSEEIPQTVLDKMESYQFGNEKKVFSTSLYGVFSFDDDDRRILKSADKINVFFNEDSLMVSTVGNIFFKNPGPDELINVRLKAYKNGEQLKFNGHEGKTKISFLHKAPKNALITDDKIVLGILTRLSKILCLS